MAPTPQWWEGRLTHSTKPASYTCPFCGARFPAMSEHMLLFPEGDHNRRRHAHSACVARARDAGTLPTKSEWQATQPRAPRRWPWRRSATSG